MSHYLSPHAHSLNIVLNICLFAFGLSFILLIFAPLHKYLVSYFYSVNSWGYLIGRCHSSYRKSGLRCGHNHGSSRSSCRSAIYLPVMSLSLCLSPCPYVCPYFYLYVPMPACSYVMTITWCPLYSRSFHTYFASISVLTPLPSRE